MEYQKRPENQEKLYNLINPVPTNTQPMSDCLIQKS